MVIKPKNMISIAYKSSRLLKSGYDNCCSRLGEDSFILVCFHGQIHKSDPIINPVNVENVGFL